MENNKTYIAWHPAFIEALQAELEEYRDILEFYPEFPLTLEPLKIDCVIINKTKNVVIKKNFATIFNEVNILEYKSPTDYVSVPDFYKVYGYACLYAFLKKIPITNMTLSFIQSKNPRSLLKHLKETRKFTVEENITGIYTVKGDILPIQIIDNRKLSLEDNIWLRCLHNDLNLEMVTRVGEEAGRKPKGANIEAYLNVILDANTERVEEIVRMSRQKKTLEEVLISTGLVAKWEAAAEARKDAELIESAKRALKKGYPIETVQDITGLDLVSLDLTEEEN